MVQVDARRSARSTSGTLAEPTGATRVACPEGERCTLLPGLVDSHVHLDLGGTAPWHLKIPDPGQNVDDLLAGGVTSALVARGGIGVARIAEDIDLGERIGPHLFLSGPPSPRPADTPSPS